MSQNALDSELAYYENAYGTYIPALFARPAVVEFRRYLVRRIVRAAGLNSHSRVLSIGCGIGDTELLLAPHVAHVTGVDLSPTAIAQADATATVRGIWNARFVSGSWQDGLLTEERFDAVIAIFFLHHLFDAALRAFPEQLKRILKNGGAFYSLDPSARRLSGWLGELLVPKLMKKYQTANERPLSPEPVAAWFRDAGFETTSRWFDFASTPLAGLFPAWKSGYRAARVIDEGLTRIPLLRALSSNFELIARKPV